MARKRNAKRAGSRNSRSKGRRTERQAMLKRVQRWLLTGMLVLLGLAALLIWASGENGQAARWLDDWLQEPQRMAVADGQRIGIIAGHKDSDSGAICPDGLTEAETVQEIAGRVVQRLRRAGAQAELLAEYDERLNNYQADVVVSIHADACIERSGYKVARSESSVIPQIEDRLVACLTEQYAAATGLPFDSYTVTEDMIGYHAFQRVADATPAAIIETGFLGGDRRLLTRQPDRVARGIVDGIICFLEAP